MADGDDRFSCREWAEQMERAMIARQDAHETQTKLDIANLAKEIRDEIKSGRRWMFGILVGLGVAIIGVLAANAFGLVTVFLRLGQLPGAT